MTIQDKVTSIINSMLEAAAVSNINKEMLNEINGLKTNFDTKALFGIRPCDFVTNNFDELPLDIRVRWFNSLA